MPDFKEEARYLIEFGSLKLFFKVSFPQLKEDKEKGKLEIQELIKKIVESKKVNGIYRKLEDMIQEEICQMISNIRKKVNDDKELFLTTLISTTPKENGLISDLAAKSRP